MFKRRDSKYFEAIEAGTIEAISQQEVEQPFNLEKKAKDIKKMRAEICVFAVTSMARI